MVLMLFSLSYSAHPRSRYSTLPNVGASGDGSSNIRPAINSKERTCAKNYTPWSTSQHSKPSFALAMERTKGIKIARYHHGQDWKRSSGLHSNHAIPVISA